MPASLLDSQFETLESPEGEPDAIRIALTGNWKEAVRTATTLSRQFIDL